MKINKEFILKNLMVIICGIIVIALFFPFVSVSVSVSIGGFGSASSGDTAVNGFQMVTQGGIFGLLVGLSLVLIAVSCLVPQLKQYKKIVSVAASVLGLISLFIAPNSLSVGESAGGSSAKSEVSFQFGFWIALIGFIALLGLSVIQLLNLKGNKFFDTINNDDTNTDNVDKNSHTPNINFNMDRIKDMAQNAASNISNAADGIKNQVSAKIAQSNNASNGSANQTMQQPNNNYQSQQQQTSVQNQTAVQQTVSIQKENPEEVMKQIKALHEMKEAGILTEEEFTEKKQEFLKKI